jgi:hypothetical protein
MFSARPMIGHADYRMPLPGLYLRFRAHRARRHRRAGAQCGPLSSPTASRGDLDLSRVLAGPGARNCSRIWAPM